MLINVNVTINKNGSMTVNWPAVANAVRYSGRVSIPSLGVCHYSNDYLAMTSFTTAANLPVNKNYEITVAAFNQKGYSIATGKKSVTMPSDYDQPPLTVPQNVKATADTVSVTVTYDAVSRASSYDVLFDGKVNSVTGTRKVFSGLKPKTSHTYAVRAKNATQTGAYSASKTITTLAQSPAIPTGFRRTVTETTASISWNAVSGATSYDVLFNGRTYTVTTTSKSFTGLTAGTGYSYQVRAKNADAASAYSNAATITTAPKAPTSVTAVSTENSVTVSWSAMTGAKSYRLKFNKTDLLVNATSHTVPNLTANTSYTYQVCSQGPDGSSSYTGSKTIWTAPKAPFVPAATATKNSVTVKWGAVTGASGYDLQFNGTVYNTTATSKTISGLTPGTAYSYSVRARNAGGASSYTAAQTISTIPNPPGVPGNVNISVTPDSATISWSPVAGATGYEVMFNNKTYSTTATSHTVTGLSEDTSYKYSVRAKNAGGSSSYSTVKTVKTPVRPPAAPAAAGISTSATTDSVTVSWGRVSGATGYDLLFNGKVYSTDLCTQRINGLTAGTNYNYAVRSKNSGGISAYGPTKTVVTIPAQPANVSVSAKIDSVTVSWGAVKGAVSYDLKFNNVIYNTTGTSRTITGLKEGTGYGYCVCAKNGSGSGQYTALRTAWTSVRPPAAPTGVKAVATHNSVKVSWNASAGATGYDLLFNNKLYGVTGTAIIVSGLAANTNYSYSVRAKNSGGAGAYGAAQTVRTLVAPPAAPVTVTATATSDTVTVTWSGVSGAVSYDVKFDGKIYNVAGTSKTFTGLEQKTDYGYAVRARNAGGPGNFSAEKTIQTLLAPPAVPTDVSAAATADSVTVSWLPAEGADSYEVLFDNEVLQVSGPPQKIEGLLPNTVHQYAVRAGNSAGMSAYSVLGGVRTLLETPKNVSAEPDVQAARIQWDAVDGASSYELEFQGGLYEVTEPFKVIAGLESESDYRYRVRAKNSYVCSAFSEEGTVRTLEDRPATPTGIRADSTMDMVILSWEKVPEADGYEVVFDGVAYSVGREEGIPGTAAMQRQGAFAVVCDANEAIEYEEAENRPEVCGKAARVYGREWGAKEERLCKLFPELRPNTEHQYTVRSKKGIKLSLPSPLQFIRTKIFRKSGLPHSRPGRKYPDGKLPHMGADPVNAMTGAFLWSYTWLEDYGKDALHFTAMYDSQRETAYKALGRKWTFSFGYLLYMDEENVYFSTPYGETAAFAIGNGAGMLQPAEGVDTEYTMEKREDGSYAVKDRDGAEFLFGGNFGLKQMTENGLVTFRFLTDSEGQVTEIESRHGAKLTFSYENGHISQAADAMGNTIAFAYEGDFLTSAINPEGAGMAFTYDTAGNLLTISDFAGMIYLTNQYDPWGRVVAQEIAGRGSSSVAYDEENRTTTFTDEAGYDTVYHYDGKLCVTAAELGANGVRNQYNEYGQLTEQRDALGNVTQMEYDEYGRMNKVIHPDGTAEEAEYDSLNRPVKVVNRDGSIHAYAYDERNNLVSATDERGNACFYGYDGNDNLISYTDKSGNLWTYAYDGNNHLSQAQDPEGNLYGYRHDAIGRLISYTSPEGKTTEYEYSAAGDLLGITDGEGSVTYTYDRNGNRIKTTDRMGNCRTFSYNGMGQVSAATDFLGNAYRFDYDERGNLTAETDPLGYRIGYAYDAMGNRISVTHPDGGAFSYVYDAVNRLIQAVDPEGGTFCYAYDAMGQVSAITNPLGHRTDYAYDAMGRVTAVTDALGHSISYTYDEAGNLLTKTDEGGAVTAYAYDAENRLSTVTTAAGVVSFAYDKLGRVVSMEDMDGYTENSEYDGDGNLTVAADKGGNRTVYFYDGNGKLTEETAPDGTKTSYAYDRNGNCTKVTDAGGNVYAYEYDANNRMVKATDPIGRETVYEYDAKGQLTAVTDPKGGVYAMEYDGSGNRVKETDPAGGVRLYVYDRMGRVVEITDEEGYKRKCTYDACGNMDSCTDANGNTWHYAYDALNRLTQVTGEDGAVYAYGYTETGRLAKVTDPEGAETSYAYDAMGRLEGMQDALGNHIGFTYDSLGRVLTQTDANGNVTSYSYTPDGKLASVELPEGGMVSYEYNALGQAVKETDALGNTVTYEYDVLGRTESVTDAAGKKTAFTYTSDGKIATVTDAGGGVTQYGYDACGNLASITDALGSVTEYEYDEVNNRVKECLSEDGVQKCITLYQYDRKGHRVKETNPLAGEKSYVYDGNGNLTEATDEDGNRTVISYDLNSRPVGMCYSDGREAAFRYNKRGELVELKDWNGTATMEYGLTGRLAKVTDHEGRVTGYAYDAAGNRTGITYPDGNTVGYAYDRDGRLVSVTDGEVQAVQYGYDAAGNILTMKRPGSTADYTYNAVRQPVKAVYRFDGGMSMEETFGYDMSGRIAGRERSGNVPGMTESTSYVYDILGRLVSYRDGQSTEAYTYDASGNRTGRSVDGITEAVCQYNEWNQLTGRTENGMPYSYGYDRRGNLTEERCGDSVIRKYVYDAAGRMVQGHNLENGETTEYFYNALGMRVRNMQTRTGAEGPAGREISYAVDYIGGLNNDLMAYEKGVGITRAVYGHGYERVSQKVSAWPDAPAAGTLPAAEPVTPAAVTAYLQPDLMGSTLLAADGQGNLLRYAERGAWGDLKAPVQADAGSSVPEDSLRFTNYRYDPVIGKHFAQARFYDSGTGRMLAVDPVRRGLNGYPYCGNDPVDYVDSTGEVVNVIIGGVAGGLIGGAFGFVGSAASQLLSGESFSLRKAAGAAANGAVVGAVRGAVLSSPAGVNPGVLAAADFVAGMAGNALEQKIVGGKVDWGESFTSGLNNAASGLIYGTNPFGSLKSAVGRSAGVGAATAAINNLSGVVRNKWKTGMYGSDMERGAHLGMAGVLRQPYGGRRSPGSACRKTSPFRQAVSYAAGRGYQSAAQRMNVPAQRRQKAGFSLKSFLTDVAVGAVTNGLAGACFYGTGKAVSALTDGIRKSGGGSSTGTVWDNIKATQDNYPNTNIPKSFEIEVNGQKMWVHGNATKHMYEDVYAKIIAGEGTAYTNPNLYTQELMSNFYGSLEQATVSGIQYGGLISAGNWEFIFTAPRQEGLLPVIKHAQFNGW